MFGWFGNNTAVMERGGFTSSSTVGSKTSIGSGSTEWSKTGMTGASGAMGAANAALSLAQAGANIMSYNSMYKRAKQNVKMAGLNIYAISENYKINNLRLNQESYKVLGSIAARAGNVGSGLDLLQESAFNAALDSYQLRQEYYMDMLNAYNQYKKAKKAKKSAQMGKIGSAIGTAAAIAAAPFTGGASLAFAGMSSQVGGQAFSSFA